MNRWIAVSLMGIVLNAFADGEVQTVRVSIQNESQEPITYKTMTINQDTHVRRYPSQQIAAGDTKHHEVIVFSPNGATTRTLLEYELELPSEQCDNGRSCTLPLQMFWQTNMGPMKDGSVQGNGNLCGSADLSAVRVTCPIPYPNQDDPSVLEITFRIERPND